ncbi:MAG: aminopeptidase N [Tetrasphaera sp.]
MPSLTRAEAQHRARAIQVTHMKVDLDLDQGDRHFGSTTTLRFTASEPGTFVDVRAHHLRRITLDGTRIDPASVADGRLPLDGLGGEHVLQIAATMAYSQDGQGLHRSLDPADGNSYVFGHMFLDAASTVFACFDQPDLKAPYAVTVRVPQDWSVLGNGAARELGPGHWELAQTPPLATYFVTICAGPWASVREVHDGIPLGVHARASLGEPLRRQAGQLLALTGQCLDYYHELFGIRYPFGEYHQVFAPEFNAGAMENPGCVTIRDTYLFRGVATEDEILTRANTIAHEMAHMWFGDLVTMRWWDDLWLNESFAEYMAHRTCVAATQYTGAWVDSTMARKLWGHSAERAPSRHPVAGSPAPTAQAALNNFDGISYAKGSAVLRQLIAHIGDDAFVAGVRDYLGRLAFGNGELADFLGAMETAAGMPLREWSTAWLETEGLDQLNVFQDTGRVARGTPPEYPRAGRPHTFDVAGFTGDAEVFRVSGTLTRSTARWPELAAAPTARIVLPNAADLTWAVSGLDAETRRNLPDGLAGIPDAQARSVAWLALIDGMHLAAVDPREVLRTFTRAWPSERNESILNRVSGHILGRVIPVFLPEPEVPAAEELVAAASNELLRGATTVGARLIAARCLVQSSTDEALLRRWLTGADLPPGLDEDSDFRWFVVRALARRAWMPAEEIERYRELDASLAGQQAALAALALRPTATAKEWAWAELTGNPRRSNYDLNAIAGAFWSSPEVDLVLPYVERYFTDIPALAARVGEDALGTVAALAYPLRVVAQRTLDLGVAALARGDLTPAVTRAIVDAQSKLTEALASRAAFWPPEAERCVPRRP